MKKKTTFGKMTLCDICGTQIGMGECGIAETIITITDDRHNAEEYVSAVKKKRMHLCDVCTASLESYVYRKRDEMRDSILRGDFYEELTE